MESEFTPNDANQANAESEQELFSNGNYAEQQERNEAQSKQNEHKRQEVIKDELHSWIIYFIRAFLSAALIAGIVFFWHMITPEYFTWNECKLLKLHFLEEKQLEKVSAFFVTIVLSSTFTGYAKKYLS